MKRKKSSSLKYYIFLGAMLLLFGMNIQLAYADSASSLSLDKTVFSPGEQVSVNFTASAYFAGNAWVGIIPSSVAHGSETVNDQNDTTYQYLNKRTSGTLVFTAPAQPGTYDLRMNDTDANGTEVASVTFTVQTSADRASTLSLSKTAFTPGEQINVNFTASAYFAGDAWVGIIPSSVAHGSEAVNDQNDTTYQYLNKRTSGTLVFTAPGQPGTYDLRMNDKDDNGVEVASVTFTVQTSADRASTLSLSKTVFTPGEQINVNFTASAYFAGDAWVGIIPSSVAHGSEAVNDQNDMTYQYLNKRTSGTLVFTAPAQPGTYDLRMNDKDDNGAEVASVTFTVGSATSNITVPSQNSANLRATPGNNSVILVWNASNESGVIGYNLYRGLYSGREDSTPVTDFPITATTYTDENVDNGNTYYYIMKPVYSDKTTGPASNEVSVTPGQSGKIIVLQINNRYMTVNGVNQEIDPGRGTVPIVVKGRTLVPIRAVIEAMGGTIEWNGAEQKVTIRANGKVIELWINKKNTRVNGTGKTTDVAPATINGRTMLPLRFVTENLGFNVDWDGATQKVTITSG